MKNNCFCKDPCSGPCGKEPCACPRPQLGIEGVCSNGANNINALRITLDGIRAEYDFTELVKSLETRTSLTVNSIKRVLTYMAEVGKDSITAAELGSILHLADLGDVSSAGAKDGSFITYEKSNNCGDGCVGTGDKWKVWNSLDEQVSSATYPMVFNSDGKPKVLERPQSPNQQYLLGWNKNNQLSYFKPKKATTKPAKGGALYWDETNQEIVYVEGA